MNTLSDELLCYILGYVDAWTLFSSVQFVSKRLRRIALVNQFWYRVVQSHCANDAITRSLYSHWTEVDWLNEWKWCCAFLQGWLMMLGAMHHCGSNGSMILRPS